MNQPADHLARQTALDPTRSFAVSAPAGSGKTGLLTQRVLTLLAHANDPEEILAITFTRKAAAEMQERINEALVLAATTERPEAAHEQLTWDLAHRVLQQDQKQNWELLKSPGRLRVQTIDGLCRAITQFQPLASGLGGSTQMLDDPGAAYQQAVQQLFKLIDDSDSIGPELGVLLSHLDNNLESAQALMMSLLQRRDQWMHALLQSRDARGYLEAVLEQLNFEVLQELRELMEPVASDLCLAADFAGTNCRNDKPDASICHLAGIEQLPGTEHHDVELWRALTDLLLTADGNWRKASGINKNLGFPTAKDKDEKARLAAWKLAFVEILGELQQIPKLNDLLIAVRILPPASYRENQWRLLDALTRVLPRLVVELQWVFRQLNATDFIEVTQGALKALGDSDSPTDTTLMLDYQIRHILVDEFQDTSTPQLQMLERLTAGWEPEDGRTLFIVGDGMQSCYGFRAANVGIFLDARSNGIGCVSLEPLDLTVNFRSQSEVVSWVNQTFEQSFPDSDDIARGAVRYSHSQAFRDALPGAAVTLHGFLDAEDRLAEAASVCNLIEDTREQYPGDSIALLVRNRGQLTDIIPALQKRGIEWIATDIEPLAQRQAIIDLMTLTRALLRPTDRNSWLALLRTPWIGLNNQDLLTVAGLENTLQLPDSHGEIASGFLPLLPTLMAFLSPEHENHHGLSEQGYLALKRTIPLLHHTWQDRYRKTLRQRVQGLWLSLGGNAAIEDETDLRNAEDFFQLLDHHEEGGSLIQWVEFERAVGNLYARPASVGADAIQVMTIHKSKGLEFDHVIIPGLDKSQRADEHQLLMWQERIDCNHEKQLLLSPLSPKGDEGDPLYQYLREEDKLKQRLETTRLLYVGCTRAIKRLHLLCNLKSTSKGDVRTPSTGALISSMWAAVKDQFLLHESLGTSDTQTHNEPENEKGNVDYRLPRLPSHWQRAPLPQGNLLASYRGREFDDDDNVPEDQTFHNRQARHLGTILHRALQQIVEEGIEHWNESRISKQLPSWSAQLQQLGISGTSQGQSLELLTKAVRNVLHDTTAQWFLDNRHLDSGCEVELWSGGKTPRQSIVDRTFIDRDERWIIDYKSSTPGTDQSMPEFLSQEREHYRAQLQRYHDLYSELDSERNIARIRTALYFPLIKHLEIMDF